MELIELLLSVGRVRLHFAITIEPQEQEPPAGPMPHLQPVDGVELDEDEDEDQLGFR
jgi:hypothetical protein